MKAVTFSSPQATPPRSRTSGATGRKAASPKTVDNYARFYRNYVRPRWGATVLTNVSYDDTASWISQLKGRDGRAAGVTTRREVALLFGRLMGFAVKRRLLPTNPTKDPTGSTDYVPGKQKLREHVYLTMPQLVSLALASGKHSLFIMLAGTCGLRWGEITALVAEDVRIGDRPSIAITKAYVEVGGKLLLGPTKGGEKRVVPVPRILADRVAELVSTRSPGQRLFSSPQGSVMRNNTWTRRHYARAIATVTEADPTFPRPTFHDLRHTAVSLAISAGANVKVVQRIAGHASATMTLDTYAGLFDDDLHDSASRLNDTITLNGWA
ncbi:tyrosine-type recombinase/integrase [Arthrobacter sp. JZ12]|uniref:tyrosine-type recombinase/integrase n=1 Tax=Arthrobacter sp. JZ12 TaxID=2654190 RepID=UPI002B47030B|nr:site-specific integrase [Arthrobacter sp. JZ12]WRH24009.1 tyrosine-type recombinase/integrase [Arthrobacter sp. JZ12]